jgi:chromate transporter
VVRRADRRHAPDSGRGEALIGENRFLHALNYCMLLPAPEAQQLAIYIGWLLHKTKGGLVAGALFVLPGFLAIMALSVIYALYGNTGLVAGLFFGLKAAVLSVVLEAVFRVGKRALNNNVLLALAAAAFIAMFFFRVPFPLVVLGAAFVGFVGARAGLSAFSVGTGEHVPAKGKPTLRDADSTLGETVPAHAQPSVTWSLKISGVFLVLWFGPVAALLLALGPHHVFSEIAVFFSKMAVVTFGGAYAVLAYVAQQVVDTHRWLGPREMLDGLGMAETTPGPLIMVTQFVGFMGAFRHPGALSPLLAGVLGGVLTTWVTFVPCFLWIFLGAPYIETIRGNRALSGALAAITAAVVGVILNLAIWFGLHVLFGEVFEWHAYFMRVDVPVLASVNVASLVLMVAAMVALFRFKLGMIPVLAACSAAGLLYYLATGAVA